MSNFDYMSNISNMSKMSNILNMSDMLNMTNMSNMLNMINLSNMMNMTKNTLKFFKKQLTWMSAYAYDSSVEKQVHSDPKGKRAG